MFDRRRGDPLTALWEAPFYAAMPFANTGFSPNAGGLTPFAHNYFMLSVLMVGVFLGSIGLRCTPLQALLARAQVVAAREAHAHHEASSVFVGAIVFLTLEFDNPKTLRETTHRTQSFFSRR